MSKEKHTYQPLVILYNDETDYETKINELTSEDFLIGTPKPAVVVLDKTTGEVVAYKNINKIISKYNLTTNKKYIDLGLSSGNLWSTCNLGASEPYEFGNYYQWGAVNGYPGYSDDSDSDSDGDGISSHSSWSSSPFNKGNGKFTKSSHYYYKKKCYPNGFLHTDYDAVYQDTGGAAHMPTANDVTELIDETTNCWCLLRFPKWEYVKEKEKYELKAKYVLGRYIEGNNQKMFIPAAGYYRAGTYISGRCLLWSNESYLSDLDIKYYYGDKIPQKNIPVDSKAHCLSFKHDNFYMDNFYKYYAMPIRGIKTKQP